MDNETVTITKKEYDSLRKDSLLLQAYESAGVDNWQGCSYAYEEYRDLLKENGLSNEDDDEY